MKHASIILVSAISWSPRRYPRLARSIIAARKLSRAVGRSRSLATDGRISRGISDLCQGVYQYNLFCSLVTSFFVWELMCGVLHL